MGNARAVGGGSRSSRFIFSPELEGEEMANPLVDIQLSKVSPSFLHANSTSHTWSFSALAELIDNAYDPDVNASQLWIDKRIINNKVCLTFVDDGNGMDAKKLLKMLSFGFCEKAEIAALKPIGAYGNGFKSGSMRLGTDAMVFTRHQDNMSVGLLSQTYLKKIGAETVLIPIVTWKLPSKVRAVTQGSMNNLRAILQHSIFHSEKHLMEELESLEYLRNGTKIIIYNLKRSNDGKLELDFESDPLDIRNSESQEFDYSSINRPVKEYSPEYRRSLREYCSILYLKPRMKIILRGKKVATKLISKSLSHTETDLYRPTWLPKPVVMTFGFSPNKKSSDDGLLMYHRNRLIKAYERVGIQKQPNELGVGVVGVVEVDFLRPIHNKQDFSKTDRYNSFMTCIGIKLSDYWHEKCGTNNHYPQQITGTLPDWLWVQCDNCLQWRRLPTGIQQKDLPDKWFCHMNPDATHNRCDVAEEPEDEDEALQKPSYEKTYKKQQEQKKRITKMEEIKKKQQKEQELATRELELKRKERELEKKKQMQKQQTYNEVSRSTELKPTQRDLNRAKKALEASIQKQREQEQIIAQLRSQKADIKQKQIQMAKSVESLNHIIQQGQKIIHPASGASTTQISSTSSSADKRRKNPVAGEPVVKRHCIKLEEGEFVTVIKNEGSAENRTDILQGSDVIDLTFSDDNDIDDNRFKQLKEPPLVSDSLQARRHYDELTKTREQLKQLRANIEKLIKIIVPNIEVGDHPIDDVVVEMIRINSQGTS